MKEVEKIMKMVKGLSEEGYSRLLSEMEVHADDKPLVNEKVANELLDRELVDVPRNTYQVPTHVVWIYEEFKKSQRENSNLNLTQPMSKSSDKLSCITEIEWGVSYTGYDSLNAIKEFIERLENCNESDTMSIMEKFSNILTDLFTVTYLTKEIAWRIEDRLTGCTETLPTIEYMYPSNIHEVEQRLRYMLLNQVDILKRILKTYMFM